MDSKAGQRSARKVRAVVPATLVIELNQMLDVIAASPRYSMIEALEIRTFLRGRGKTVSGIEGLSLADVVEMGADRFCELEGMGPAKVRTLIKFIAGLVDEKEVRREEKSQQLPSSVSEGPIGAVDNRTSYDDLPIMSSVQAEQLITQSLEKLKNSPEFPAMRKRRLGEFWDSGWPKAPFEESMLLGQLIEMKADYLLKKNSFFGRKVSAFIKAIERACQHGNVPAAQARGVNASVEHFKAANSAAESYEARRLAEWGASVGTLPRMAEASLSYFVAQLSAAADRKSVLTQIALAMTKQLGAADFLCLWAVEDYAAEQAQKILGDRADMSQARIIAAQQLVVRILSDQFLQVKSNWEALLRGPGVSHVLLAEPYLDVEWDRGLQEALTGVCVRALGAEHPSIGDYQFTHYFTLNRSAFDTAVGAIRLLRGSAQIEQLEQQVRSLLPYFDSREIIARIS